jgi:tocopherol cyclase
VASLYKIFHPEIFQGSLNGKNYFEGWYFKHVSENADDAFAVIPGISLSDDTHAFIQYNEGRAGRSSYFRYDLSEFSFDRKKLVIKIGNSVFTEDGVSLDLTNDAFNIKGDIGYSGMIKPPSNLLMPGIMGWYSYVPWMECNHAVLSVTHHLSGSLQVNGKKVDFTKGKGYTEKDWGISFPESWLWLQCNNFQSPDASFMISIAKIPWRGSFFIGFVAFYSINGKTEILATYNGGKVLSLRKIPEDKTEVVITKGNTFVKTVILKKGDALLKAPSSGLMNNIIKESIDTDVNVEIMRSGKTIFSEKGIRSGYEETEGIFKYFK